MSYEMSIKATNTILRGTSFTTNEARDVPAEAARQQVWRCVSVSTFSEWIGRGEASIKGIMYSNPVRVAERVSVPIVEAAEARWYNEGL